MPHLIPAITKYSPANSYVPARGAGKMWERRRNWSARGAGKQEWGMQKPDICHCWDVQGMRMLRQSVPARRAASGRARWSCLMRCWSWASSRTWCPALPSSVPWAPMRSGSGPSALLPGCSRCAGTPSQRSSRCAGTPDANCLLIFLLDGQACCVCMPLLTLMTTQLLGDPCWHSKNGFYCLAAMSGVPCIALSVLDTECD